MSHHPYRQKAVVEEAGAEVPYPTQDYDPQQQEQEQEHTNQSESVPQVREPEYQQSPGYSYNSGVGDGFGAGLQGRTFSHKPQLSTGSSSSGGFSPHPEQLPHDYPQSPPPVFSNRGNQQIVSPTLKSLSATSSMTNLNLNGSHHQSQNMSLAPSGGSLNVGKHRNSSETHIDGFNRYGHTRAVSSTSSFMNDKSDSVSMVDYSHNIIQQYLGLNLHRSVPRIKTLELYRQNAKKSNDPTVLFQYAQYMLQTALMMEDGSSSTSLSNNNSGQNSPTEANSPRKTLSVDISTKKKKSASSQSLSQGSSSDDDTSNSAFASVSDKKLKKELLREALHYLRRLSDKGYVDAQYLLADAHSSGALGKIENRYSFVLFQTAAKHGHIESAYRTSYCYEEGLGTGRDARKAMEYLKMAALKNHSAAMYKLGVYSFYGRMGMGSDVNTKKMGIKWLTRASNIATELTAAAPYELGKIYFTGFKDIVIPDEKYALELYSQAAALGHIELARILGHCYEVGEIVPQDSNLSIHYYTQAALGGDPESMLAMCAWYLVGSEPFLPKDELEAFEWAKRSAQCNFVKAQYALGNFYEKGVGCEKDLNQSQEWYKRAAEGGDEKSLSRILDKDWLAKFNKSRKFKRKPNLSNTNNNNNNNNNKSSDATPKNAAAEKDCIIM